MFRIFTFFAALLVLGCKIPSGQYINPEMFLNPPSDAGLHTYWQWVDGYVSREGITLDLEAMKKAGIVQAVILNVSMFDGKDLGSIKIPFSNEEWFSLFKWAIQEAHRLGIFIGVHNSNGWSGSGGPWITPEMSMKKYIWTSAHVKGHRQVSVQLRKPLGLLNFYKDVAVIAVKTDKTNESKVNKIYRLNGKTDAGALNDGSPISHLELKKGDTISITGRNKFRFSKIAVTPYHSAMWGDVETFEYKLQIHVRNKNSYYRMLPEVTIVGANKVSMVNLPETCVSEVLIVLSSAKNKKYQVPASLGEIELLDRYEEPLYSPKIPDFLEKAAFSRSSQEQYFSRILATKPVQLHKGDKLSSVIDISSKLDSTGLLNWEVPYGNWKIFRFGYTTTGALTNPVPASESGLECDKMDTTALNFHFHNFPDKLIRQAGAFTGNTFRFLMEDSYECSYMNWTASLPEQFKKRTGYSLFPWIPVLCGDLTTGSEEAEAFLFDFRKVIASLIEENYYKHLQALCHRNKLEFHAEMIYGNYSYPPLEIIRANQYADVPMTEFWTNTDTDAFIQFNPLLQREIHFPVSTARVYDFPVVSAEAYTGLAHFSETLHSLKPFGDRAFCEGINQLVLHSMVHQPDNRKPGFTLGRYASHFNRHNLYWPAMKEWGQYQKRIQYMLQKGTTVADVLYFAGDQLPQFNYPDQFSKIPMAYHLTAVNYDALKNRITVENKKLVLNNKDTASLLIVNHKSLMHLETLKRLEELVASGAIVYSNKPEKMLQLVDVENRTKEFQQIVDKVWGKAKGLTERQYGHGYVYCEMPIEEVISKNKMAPDFSCTSDNKLALNYIHKRIGKTDYYFVANQLDSTFQSELKFRVAGKVPEVWDPVDGSVKKLNKFNCQKGQTSVSFRFKPYQSLFFVFMPENEEDFSIEKFLEPDEKIQITNLAGEMEFKASYPVCIQPLQFNLLTPVNEAENPDIKYFSGDVLYKTTFKCSSESLITSKRVYLNIGRFGGIARVKLNGKKFPILWYLFQDLDVTGFLKNENSLELTVTNNWRNRIIGDLVQYGQLKNIWTSANVMEFLNKNSRLEQTGWIGPLEIKLLHK